MLLGALGRARRYQIPQQLLQLLQRKLYIFIAKIIMLLGDFGRPRRQLVQLLQREYYNFIFKYY